MFRSPDAQNSPIAQLNEKRRHQCESILDNLLNLRLLYGLDITLNKSIRNKCIPNWMDNVPSNWILDMILGLYTLVWNHKPLN
jgi:hypothetical protein